MAWDYKREEKIFEEIPEGDHRCVIDTVEKSVSKAGNEMIVLKVNVSGYEKSIFHYVVFLNDYPEITNRNLTSIFDSFAIEEGDFVLEHWEGKAGACHVKHDDEGRAKISYFLKKGSKKEVALPAYVDKVGLGGAKKVEDVRDEDLPF